MFGARDPLLLVFQFGLTRELHCSSILVTRLELFQLQPADLESNIKYILKMNLRLLLFF